jgi:DNA-binding CsgD family transcriptional regulator
VPSSTLGLRSCWRPGTLPPRPSPVTSAGGRGRRATETGVALLTASERRIAELAAQGYTNRNIAGLLQISIKGVEWHLHQSYRKLDVAGRAQLGPALLGAA